MKEMIDELTKRFDRWARANAGDLAAETGLFDTMGRSLIAVMERLDAMGQPPKVAWVEDEPRTRVEYIGTYAPITVEERKDIERAAMIKALRWSANNATCGHTLCSGMRVIADGVRRIENGGEL